MEDAKAAVNSVESDIESDDGETEEIVDVKVDGGDEDEEEHDGSGDDEDEDEEDGSDEDEDEDEDSEDDEAASEEEDLGTEYLIQPVGRAEDEEGASDFEPNNESDVDEDIDEEEEDTNNVSGRIEASSKRRRPSIDGAVGNVKDDDERPSKR